MSLLIAKCSKPHTIVEIMLGEGLNNNISQSVSLNNNIVSRQIVEMAIDNKFKLTNLLKKQNLHLSYGDADNPAGLTFLLLTHIVIINNSNKTLILTTTQFGRTRNNFNCKY